MRVRIPVAPETMAKDVVFEAGDLGAKLWKLTEGCVLSCGAELDVFCLQPLFGTAGAPHWFGSGIGKGLKGGKLV